ncbi:hypothetical protein BDD43_4618 [Mucilaginibacter gracilis]|uniref:Uncharacterized protein n=1 Tax=Mucilaginibacter gracilis TaxID=423350 RepID=A0A495J6M3_9SPHI|nr:hypothetical protein BDD43_4618 [Mucilaginibacter gracilis]
MHSLNFKLYTQPGHQQSKKKLVGHKLTPETDRHIVLISANNTFTKLKKWLKNSPTAVSLHTVNTHLTIIFTAVITYYPTKQPQYFPFFKVLLP